MWAVPAGMLAAAVAAIPFAFAIRRTSIAAGIVAVMLSFALITLAMAVVWVTFPAALVSFGVSASLSLLCIVVCLALHH